MSSRKQSGTKPSNTPHEQIKQQIRTIGSSTNVHIHAAHCSTLLGNINYLIWRWVDYGFWIKR